MMQREKQTDWFADIIEEYKNKYDLIYILGKSFKSELNIKTGSPAVLLKNILKERGLLVTAYDPYVDDIKPTFKKGIFFIGTKILKTVFAILVEV